MNSTLYYLGIDVGTSSVKALAVFENGASIPFYARYEKNIPPPLCWENAVYYCIGEVMGKMGHPPKAIAICGQVGTYLLQTPQKPLPTVVHWGSGGGEETLRTIKEGCSDEFFIKHISMRHPNLVSYPLVRLLQMRKERDPDFLNCTAIMAPKDYLYIRLTGEWYSDPYTWRGLASIEGCKFSDVLLKRFELDKGLFPPLAMPWEAPGKVTREASLYCGLPEGIPVFLGCNDFFASILGMGSSEKGKAFDVTGTSEHIGMICPEDKNVPLISGPYFSGYAIYGVTASSGISMNWAFEQFSAGERGFESILAWIGEDKTAAPLFLPYMRGERAPIWDSRARGVFFGLSDSHSYDALFYSVMEGVVFSICHIWEQLGNVVDSVREIRVGGGASADQTLNRMKASLLQKPFVSTTQKECGALGMAIIAMYGDSRFSTLEEGQKLLCGTGTPVLPNEELFLSLKERYDIYRDLYKSLKNDFEKWHRL